MAGLTSVLLTRWMIAFHEMRHLHGAEELDLFTQQLALPFAAFNIDYRE